ncbi:MAG: hypothetical protein PHI27_10610 [Eubacteriales bacterium]|nr:hypothetical protein [Eubacteriales bacterium]MDD3882692.1 hypothetical protein [Eubacteriales bacterium]MDD4512736.1 hypothetical protein [Eubacteriales bacterium]
MKKLICLFAALIFSLMLPLGCAVCESATAEKVLFPELWLSSRTIGDTYAYVKTMSGEVMRQSLDGGEQELICDLLSGSDGWNKWDWNDYCADAVASSQLVYGDGKLYAVSGSGIGLVDENGIDWLDVTFSDEPKGYITLWCFVKNGMLYGLTERSDINRSGNELPCDADVLIVSLDDGEFRELETVGAEAIIPYKDDSLLLLHVGSNGNRYLSELYAESGEMSELSIRLPDGVLGGLSWDEESDCLALFNERDIFISRAGGEFESAGEHQLTESYDTFFQYRASLSEEKNRYAFISGNGFSVIALGAASPERKRLVVSGPFNDSMAKNSFLSRRSDVELVVSDDSHMLSPAEAADKIRSQDASDLYGVWLMSGFKSYIRKGYALPLELGQDVDNMLPAIKDAILGDDGKPHAAVQSLNIGLRQLNAELWNKVLGSEKAPETWAEYFRLQKRMLEDYYDAGILLTDYFSCENEFWDVLEAWAGQSLAEGKAVDFETPVFREALSALYEVKQALDERGLSVLDEAEMYPESETVGDYSLIWFAALESVMGINGEETDEILLPLVFSQGDEPVISARAQTIAISPLCKNPELATEFIKEYLSFRKSNKLDALLFPSTAVPLENEGWKEKGADYAARLAVAKREYAAADELSKDTIGARIAELEWRIKQNDSYRWDVSPYGIEKWRSLSRYVQLFDSPLICERDSEFGSRLMELGKRWLSGQLSLDSLLAQLEEKTAMMAAEEIE